MAESLRPRERQLRRGALFPTVSDVKSITTKLKKEIATNRNLAAAYKKDPRSVLAAVGLNEDVQNELLLGAGLTAQAKSCLLTCLESCWFTNININIA